MKHSIRTKIILLIFFALVLLALILGSTSIISTQRLTDEYAHQNIKLICENEASDINSIFTSLEHSVDYMSVNALEEISNPMNMTDIIYYENYIEKMKGILWNTSNNISDSIAVYLRLNPELCGSKSGIFMTRDSVDSELKNSDVTDLSLYLEDDIGYVGWYYEPIKAKEPIWMDPYYNKNINIYMISYIVPLFKEDVTMGVLGMDINFNYIIDQIKNIKVYNSGYAYITDLNGNIIYHPTLNYGDKYIPKDGWWNESCQLTNGMILNITVPEIEVNKSRNDLITNLCLGSVFIMIIFIVTTTFITNKMISPLQKLNDIAHEISAGNYDVDFSFSRPSDEIGELTKSFESTVKTLKEYMVYINGLAYKDALTGVRNRTAYEHQLSLLEEELVEDKDYSFIIAVFDVNNLKLINDNLGHEKGDILIKGVCKLICHTFNHSAVFRIGGDEFTAIIKETDDAKVEEVFKTFIDEMEKTWSNEEPENQISVAYGYSRYNKTLDKGNADSVFKRADDLMYENKKIMKQKFNEYKNSSKI